VSGAEELSPDRLAAALTEASEMAYRGVSRPVEGTILTVAREAGIASRAAAGAGADLPGVLEQTLQAANAAVAATPSQLEVLKKAGVVDSGGEGYRAILEGAWMWSTGRTIEEGVSHPYGRADVAAIEHQTALGFCTEFLLRDADVDLSAVKDRMEALGDSVIAVGDPTLLRVHMHTLRPGQALEFAVDHGTIVKVKVENMELQREALAEATRNGAAVETSAIGVVAVAAGAGLQKVFRSLGARVVQGGQSMNPSVQEILAAVNSSGHHELILLPNNRNVILTAQHVQELTPHSVAVIPTESAPQGIGALLAFNFQADMQTNVAAMDQAAHSVHTIEVTRAVRDADADGVHVRSGDWLGIYNGRVVVATTAADAALLDSLAFAPVDGMEIVTIYYGAAGSEDQAAAVASQIRQAHPGLDVEVVNGGQPHYPYIASLE
jgi:DAK2 domain fusion protein YloV